MLRYGCSIEPSDVITDTSKEATKQSKVATIACKGKCESKEKKYTQHRRVLHKQCQHMDVMALQAPSASPSACFCLPPHRHTDMFEGILFLSRQDPWANLR